MKFKTTKKDIMNGYAVTIGVSYCGLQTLLRCESPRAYTARREGWCADIYDFGMTAIVTGYAPFGTVRPDCETVRKYEKAAEKIAYNYSLKWEEQKAQLSVLIREFIEEVTK